MVHSMDAEVGVTLITVFGLKGIVAYDLVAGSLKTAKYLTFLERLMGEVGQRDIGLFYDGSSVHKSSAAQQRLE